MTDHSATDHSATDHSATDHLLGYRASMDPTRVDRLMTGPTRFTIEHIDQTGSTNVDLMTKAARSTEPVAGDQVGALVTLDTVLITEEQTAGRGRAGRAWSCPPGAGLMFSVLLAVPEIAVVRRGWIGAALGVAAVSALTRIADLRPNLKWPNDLLIGPAKCAGILAETSGDRVVVGMGMNVSLRASELPRPDATSLMLSGAGTMDRELILAGILDDFSVLLGDWRRNAGDVDRSGLRDAYRAVCSTLGARVRIELPGGTAVAGLATDIEPDGSITIRPDGAVRSRSFTAGDVVHLRAES